MPEPTSPRRLPLDGAVVPALLLLVARDLALFDPPRELAWPLFHELLATPKPAWLAAFLPRPEQTLFHDPVGLILATAATGLAAAYALAALFGARPRVRAGILGIAALVLVLLPTAWAIGLGMATGHPYGHDGGVVQLPLALEKVLAGESPYGADYSQGALGEQSRASTFWQPLGGNPIVRHHWYLPGMHLAMAPFFLAGRALLGGFDPRVVTSLAFVAAILLIARLPASAEGRLAAAALVAVNPFVYWAQSFGTNDVLSAVPLLIAALLARRGRTSAAAVALGVACAVKQLAWPFAPFFIVELAGLRSFREALSRAGLGRLARPLAIALATFLALVLPVALLDPGAFVADIFRYQTGSPGSDQYPFGGTPGFGIANLLIYAGAVHRLSDYYPFQRFYLLLLPLGLLLLRFQFRRPGLPAAFVAGSVALLASVYLSRIPNPNYLILATLFLPLALLLDPELAPDLAVVPLLLLLVASEAALREPLRSAWESGAFGLPSWLAPAREGPRWRDPLSIGWSGLLSALAMLYLVASVAGAGPRVRQVLLVLSAALGVGLPLATFTASTRASGVVRAQDGFIVEVLGARDTPGPGDWAARPGVVRTPVVEAWPASWRRDPPRPLPASDASPGSFTLGRALRASRLDPRVVMAVALFLAAAVAARAVADRHRAAVLGVLLLGPASVGSVLFGGGEALTLVLVLAALTLARSRSAAAAFAIGAAGAISLVAAVVAPLVALRPRTRALVALGFVAAGSALILGFPAAFAHLLLTSAPLRPGIGLSNLFYYRPDLPASWPTWLHWKAAVLLVVLPFLAARGVRRGASRFGTAAALTTGALFLWPGIEAAAVAVPIALFAVAASRPVDPLDAGP